MPWLHTPVVALAGLQCFSGIDHAQEAVAGPPAAVPEVAGTVLQGFVGA